MHLPWLLLSLSIGATILGRTNALITPKTMITTTNTTKPGCQRKCGSLTIPYPFGIGDDCYLQDSFRLICNTSYNPPRAFPVIPFGWDILDITETQVTIRNTNQVASRCHDSQGNVSSETTGSLDMWGTPYTISHTANLLTVIGCNNYALFGGSRHDTKLYQRAGCITLCNNIIEAVPGSCPSSGCCQTSVPIGWQGFSISVFSLESTLAVPNLGRFLSNQSCSYAFYAKKGSFIFGGASDLKASTGVLNRIMQQVPVVLDWNVRLNTSCKQANEMNSTNTPYPCGSNSECVDTDAGGYRCRCSAGYEGNPYLEHGCKDINECTDPSTNPCERICENTPGGYKCFCPKGYTGDGLSSGMGCLPMIDVYSPILLRITFGGIISLGTILLLLGGWWLSSVIKRRRIIKQKAEYFERNGGLLLQQQMAIDESVVAGIKIFTVDELERATDHFNEDRILGHGGQGTVYKGMLSEGKLVAIKKSEKVDESQLGGFINEVVILSQINHRNIVKLLGCCLETEVPILIYEYVSNGTLFEQIHHPSEDFSMTWKMRLQIACDTAGALVYLHTSSSIPIFHRDIKSSNILLDDKYRAKLSDFGTSKSVDIDQTHVTTRVMGTFGYLDPEYFQSNQFTEKSDVYSFGVVLVELLTGQKAIRSAIQEDRSLVSWFLSHLENSNLLDIIDVQVLQEGSEEEFLTIANIGRLCLNLDGKRRPTMKEVLLEIEGAMSLHLPLTKTQNWPIEKRVFSGTSKNVYYNSISSSNTSYSELERQL